MPGQVTEISGSFGRKFLLSDHCRDRWAERFPHALSTVEHAVRFARVVRENNYGLVLYYAQEHAAFVCNAAPGGYWVSTVVNTFGRGGHVERFVLEKRKPKNQRLRDAAKRGRADVRS